MSTNTVESTPRSIGTLPCIVGPPLQQQTYPNTLSLALELNLVNLLAQKVACYNSALLRVDEVK